MEKESGDCSSHCDHHQLRPCRTEILRGFWTNFLKGCAIKLVLRLITEWSLAALAKDPFNIPKFGVVVGLFSGLYKLARCLLNRYWPELTPCCKTYAAGMFCSLALLLANPGEQAILKMLIYPRALECLF